MKISKIPNINMPTATELFNDSLYDIEMPEIEAVNIPEVYLPFGNKTAQHRENSKKYRFKSRDAYVNDQRKLLRFQQKSLCLTSNNFAVDIGFSLC